MRVPSNLSQIAEVFVDESSQNNHRYLVLGCIVVALVESRDLRTRLLDARYPELPAGEAKWAKVSRTKLPAYRRIVDVFFDNPNLAHFHSLFVDTTKLDHQTFNQGSREIGFNKEIYQLGTKVSRLYADRLFHLYPDKRETNQRPEDLRLILNRGCRSRGDRREWPFRRCQFRDSATTLPLQLADILIGAIAYRLNGHHTAEGASPAKCELSEYVLTRAGVRAVEMGTPRTGRFTIWRRQLR